ncbi:MAG TPA: AbrB/MazE/SpoVT family DNA-binding domain-containing protein [Desulfosporosinus sp.]
MKSTGLVRKVDELGRIVLPIELRRALGIAKKDAMEIYVDQGKIVFKKYEPVCVFCGNVSDSPLFHGKNVCSKCIIAIGEAVPGSVKPIAV